MYKVEVSPLSSIADLFGLNACLFSQGKVAVIHRKTGEELFYVASRPLREGDLLNSQYYDTPNPKDERVDALAEKASILAKESCVARRISSGEHPQFHAVCGTKHLLDCIPD